MPHVRAGASYLLGEFADAVRLGGDGVEAGLAEIARSGSAARLPLIRERLVDIAMASTNGPSDAVGDPLTTWDWLEESFLLESRLTGAPVPSHLEMLDRLGVLTDEPRPPVPPMLSPAVGLRVDLPSGAWLGVERPDWVEVFVPPAFRAVLRQHVNECWGAWIPDGPDSSGEWIVEPEFPDWRHAATATAQWISANRRPESEAARQAATIAELVVAAGGDAGEAVPKPRERVGMPPNIQYPTIEFNDGDIIDIELADDLIVQFRTPLEAPQWYGRVAFEPLALMDDVVPPPHPTWQDAARQMAVWLEEHQNGRGVAALEQLIREHS